MAMNEATWNGGPGPRGPSTHCEQSSVATPSQRGAVQRDSFGLIGWQFFDVIWAFSKDLSAALTFPQGVLQGWLGSRGSLCPAVPLHVP